jgi:hypothetical protein
LGERLLCKQEVIGSIPFTSTSLRAKRDGCHAETQRVKAGLFRATAGQASNGQNHIGSGEASYSSVSKDWRLRSLT